MVGIGLAATVGILVAEVVPLPGGLVSALVLAGASVLAWRGRTLLVYLLVAAAFCALHLLQTSDAPGRELLRRLGRTPRFVSVTGAVESEPKISGNGYATFLLQLDALEVNGRRERSGATVRARWKGQPQLGDDIRLQGILETIPPTRNPGVFDQAAYFARLDVHQSLFARYRENGAILASDRGNFLLKFAAKSRAWMQATLTRGLEDSPAVGALLSGMTLGLRHETKDDIEEPFQQTGTLHLFAVAGLHVGIIAQLLWIVARLLRLPRKWAATLIIPFLFFYAAVTGGHVSSWRAATMAAVLLGGIYFERRVFALNSLAAAAVLILACASNQLFSAGFQLSFAVVGAIILGQNALFRPLQKLSATDPFLPRSLVRPGRLVFERGYRWVARGISVSAAAWAGSLLLIVWYFYLVTPISLLANLAVVPVAFAILATSLMSLLAAPFSLWLSIVFNNANWSLAHIVLWLVHLFSLVPGGHAYVERPHWPTGAKVEMTVLDAGAGAAVHLRTRGQDWLFDCGSARDYQTLLRDYLHSRGIDRLDGLVLSHGDSLHIGGAPALAQEFRPRRLLDNAAPDKSRVHRSLIERLPKRELVARGDTIEISPDVVVRVLYPPPGIETPAADDKTLVLQLEIEQRFRVLLLSDSGPLTEDALLLHPNELTSAILIKGQHLSGRSGSEQLLEAVRPHLLIATSVAFPARERVADDWAEWVRARGVTLFRQDETGAVRLEFFPQNWRARPFLKPHETFRSSSR